MRCSLIIPAYNAKNSIRKCVETALNQSISSDDYEIIIVDDGSTDGTRDVAGAYPVRVIQQQNQGPAVARNRGAAEAKGDILVFTDSDCEVDHHFLEKMIAPIEDNPDIVGVQGGYKSRQKEFMAQFCQVEIETRYDKMLKNRYIDFIGTYAAAYTKEIFQRYGGFDEGFPMASGEDTEFSYKLQKDGHKLVFSPEAIVYHLHPNRFKTYISSKYYRGYWRIRLYQKHPEKTINDSYTPQSLKFQVLSVPFLFLFFMLSFFNMTWLIPCLLVLFSYLIFSIPFFRKFAMRNDPLTSPMKILIPCTIILRTSAIFFGLLVGSVNVIKKT